MENRDLIVIGASAGGVEALKRLAAGLAPDLPAAVVVAIHTAPHRSSQLPDILAGAGVLPVQVVRDGERLQRGRIYLPPPDHHLLVKGEALRLSRGAHENRHRPSIDVLFRSAALSYGPRVVGAVLTGELDDGTAGLSAIKRCGGIAVIQAPDDARHASMPASALRHVRADHCAPLTDIVGLLDRLAREPPGESPQGVPETIRAEELMTEMESSNRPILDEIGDRTALTCPDCHGVLWSIKDTEVPRFRCHVGHAYFRTPCSEPTPSGWRTPCGRRSGPSAKAPISRRGWPSARSAAATRRWQDGSAPAARPPGSMPPLCVS
jgi:two-component system, chemotaxis family, protein-glutamate methylesterase/glutaminase